MDKGSFQTSIEAKGTRGKGKRRVSIIHQQICGWLVPLSKLPDCHSRFSSNHLSGHATSTISTAQPPTNQFQKGTCGLLHSNSPRNICLANQVVLVPSFFIYDRERERCVAPSLHSGTSKAKAKACDKGWECSKSVYCCNQTISDFFQVYQFENLFAKRNTPVAQAAGYWDYQSFITASALYQPHGFGTTGGKLMQMREVAAFLGHVGSRTSCGYNVATGGPYAWGLCYNHEMSPSQSYCQESYLYPCTPGVDYYGRGALPVYWNYNYGVVGEGIKADLLHHPENLEQNATLAFQAAIWRWMTPIKKKQPSAHDVFVGNWKPTKNDTLSKRFPGFGATMNVLYGDQMCGQGQIDSMNNIMSHYSYYLDLMGVGQEHAGDNLDCAEQLPFNPSSSSATS